jgi:hypothetical protein
MASDEGLAEEPRRLGAIMHRLGLVISGNGDVAADSAFADLPALPLRNSAHVAAVATLVFVAIETGQRWSELDDYLGRVVRDAVRHRMRDAAGMAACGMARLHLVRGRYRDATRWLAEAEIHLLRHDPFGAMVLVRCTAVGIACFTGDFDGTLTEHERLEAWTRSAHRSPLSGWRWLAPRPGRSGCAVRPPRARVSSTTRISLPAACRGWRRRSPTTRFGPAIPALAPALAYDALRSGHPGAPAVVASLADRCRSPSSRRSLLTARRVPPAMVPHCSSPRRRWPRSGRCAMPWRRPVRRRPSLSDRAAATRRGGPRRGPGVCTLPTKGRHSRSSTVSMPPRSS